MNSDDQIIVQPATQPTSASGMFSPGARAAPAVDRAGLLADGPPAGSERLDLPIERDERGTVRLRTQERRGHPAHGRERDGRQQRRVRAEVEPVLREDEEDQRDHERTDHGHDFAPGVHAPPEPAHR